MRERAIDQPLKGRARVEARKKRKEATKSANSVPQLISPFVLTSIASSPSPGDILCSHLIPVEGIINRIVVISDNWFTRQKAGRLLFRFSLGCNRTIASSDLVMLEQEQSFHLEQTVNPATLIELSLLRVDIDDPDVIDVSTLTWRFWISVVGYPVYSSCRHLGRANESVSQDITVG